MELLGPWPQAQIPGGTCEVPRGPIPPQVLPAMRFGVENNLGLPLLSNQSLCQVGLGVGIVDMPLLGNPTIKGGVQRKYLGLSTYDGS